MLITVDYTDCIMLHTLYVHCMEIYCYLPIAHIICTFYVHTLLIAIQYTHDSYILCTYTVNWIRLHTLYIHFMSTLLHYMHKMHKHDTIPQYKY